MKILEDYLDRFDGIIIIVSHDRYFLDRTVNRIFSFEGEGEIHQFEGGYSDYLIRKELEAVPEEKVSAGKAEKADKDANKDAWKQHEKKIRFTYKEQKEFESIDDDIAELEGKIEKLDQEIAQNVTNSSRLNDLLKEKEQAEQELDEKMDRWVYLNDLNEQIKQIQ